MKLSEFKKQLSVITDLNFVLQNGIAIPKHFHVTEVGQVIKNFVDCGGTIRNEKVVNFQLWEAADFDHRLAPQKLVNIIELSEKVLNISPELEIEVEYQGETIGKYGLNYNGIYFKLIPKITNCLAPDMCGIPVEKQKVQLQNLGSDSSTSCTPGSGCC